MLFVANFPEIWVMPHNSDSIDVDVKNSPQKLLIQVQSDNKQLCNQQSEVLLSVDNLSSLQLQWYRNGLLINNETNKTLKVTQSGTYTIKIDDATTKCNSNSDPYEVILLPRKDVILETSDKKLTYCTGDKISASVSNWPDVTYTWYFNNDKLVEGKSLNTIDITKQGIYKVDILDNYNCKASSQSLSISILDKIPIEFLPIESMCVSDPSVVLQATPGNGFFSGVGIDGKKFNPKISGAGIFNISYEITNMNACQNGKISRTVEVFPLPTPESLAKALYIRKGQTVVLNMGNKINYSYEWTPRDYLSDAFIGNPNCTPTQNIEYQYKIKNEYGCLYQGSVKVFIEENILVPNIFTPNNDGYNDTWELFGMDSYTDVEVMIYNRWGNLVFFSIGYNNPFDGKDINGIDCPNDSYAYVIKFVKSNGLPYELKGGLTIAR